MSYEDAFDGLRNIRWGNLCPGGTLYICGEHTTENLVIGASGTEGKPVSIVGHSAGATIFPHEQVVGSWVEDVGVGAGVYKLDLNDNPGVLFVDDMVIGKINNTDLASADSKGWGWMATAPDEMIENYNRIETPYWDGIGAMWGHDANGIKDANKPVYIRFADRESPDRKIIFKSLAGSSINTNGHSNITIRGIGIKNTRYGVYVDGGANITIEDIYSIGNYYMVSLNGVEGNITIQHNKHRGSYYGMDGWDYLPNFGYPHNETQTDRDVQVAARANSAIKTMFPSMIFNQCAVANFGETTGPIVIRGNDIKDVQRGFTFYPAYKPTKQSLIINDNHIDGALRTAISVSPGWDAVISGNTLVNANIVFRIQSIDAADSGVTERKVSFDSNWVHNKIDAGYGFFFHHSGDDAGEALQLLITDNNICGGGGTNWLGFDPGCFLFVHGDPEKSRDNLGANSVVEGNTIQWNTLDSCFGTYWSSVDHNTVYNHADNSFPEGAGIGANNTASTSGISCEVVP